MSKNFYFLIIVVAIAIGSFVLLKSGDREASRLDEFAKCLADKGIAIYGADWCPHCQNEKKAFGDSFRLVPYIECPEDPKRCLAAGIAGFPTWIFSDGRKLEGEQGLEKLSRESGCLLPQ